MRYVVFALTLPQFNLNHLLTTLSSLILMEQVGELAGIAVGATVMLNILVAGLVLV